MKLHKCKYSQWKTSTCTLFTILALLFCSRPLWPIHVVILFPFLDMSLLDVRSVWELFKSGWLICSLQKPIIFLKSAMVVRRNEVQLPINPVLNLNASLKNHSVSITLKKQSHHLMFAWKNLVKLYIQKKRVVERSTHVEKCNK